MDGQTGSEVLFQGRKTDKINYSHQPHQLHLKNIFYTQDQLLYDACYLNIGYWRARLSCRRC
jgi:hypothetical protein